MPLFRLDASIRQEASASRALADLVEEQWRSATPDATVHRRDIGLAPLPSDAWPAAVVAGYLPEPDRSPAQRAAVALASTLTDELVAADALLLAVPLYNFGVSQHFKTYVDLVSTDPRMTPGTDTAIAGRRTVLVTVQGGSYGPGTPKEGWNHATAWMRRILEDVWHVDLEVVSRELKLVGVNPALDALTDLARQLRTDAEDAARDAGRRLADAGMATSPR